MLNNRWIKLLAAILLAFGMLAGSRQFRPTAGDPPTLKLPASVTGRPGRLIVIAPETSASVVRWHACAGAERPELWHSPDGKTLVFCAPTPGRYELWAWAAANGEATESVGCTINVESPEPPPAPDPFVAALRVAWDSEAASDRVKQRDLLASLYRIAADETVRQPHLTTIAALFAALQQASKTLLPGDALPRTCAAIAAELRMKLPIDPAAPLDAAARERCREQFARVAKLLSDLR